MRCLGLTSMGSKNHAPCTGAEIPLGPDVAGGGLERRYEVDLSHGYHMDDLRTGRGEASLPGASAFVLDVSSCQPGCTAVRAPRRWGSGNVRWFSRFHTMGR